MAGLPTGRTLRRLRRTSPAGAQLFPTSIPVTPAAVVLVLHGGPETGTSRCRWFHPQVLRCRILAAAVARYWTDDSLTPAIYRLQYAWTGWDGDGREAIRDTAWALGELSTTHPGLPVAFLAHSMGGRVAAQLDLPVGIVGLAPWLPAADPVDHLTGRQLVAVHGSRDREVPAASTVEFLTRASAAGVKVERITIRGGGHAMLYRIGRWNRIATDRLAAVLSAT